MDPVNYRFSQVPLTPIFEKATSSKQVGNVFLGEWMNVLTEKKPQNGLEYEHFRGGYGWVESKNIGPERKLEVFFIDVGQGDSILIQTQPTLIVKRVPPGTP